MIWLILPLPWSVSIAAVALVVGVAALVGEVVYRLIEQVSR